MNLESLRHFFRPNNQPLTPQESSTREFIGWAGALIGFTGMCWGPLAFIGEVNQVSDIVKEACKLATTEAINVTLICKSLTLSTSSRMWRRL